MKSSQTISCINTELAFNVSVSISIIWRMFCLHAILIHKDVICPSLDHMGNGKQSYGQWCPVPAQARQGGVCWVQMTDYTPHNSYWDRISLLYPLFLIYSGLGQKTVHVLTTQLITSTLDDGDRETVSEMSLNSTLTWLTAWEGLNVYCCHESFKSYTDITLLTSVDIKIPLANTCTIFCDTI